jgi:glycosyltransferase involved in cell wall biosynthesis
VIADAAIIIPHYNDVERLMRCLAALWPQHQLGIEIIVVDNGSTESLGPIQLAYPNLRIVTEVQKGAAHARNRGVAETTGRILCFLDCDCIPAPDWLAVALSASTRADLIGGQVVVFDETPPPRTGAQAFEAVFAFDNKTYVERKGFSVSANLITNRNVFNSVGPFVHGLSEDLDWCRRATAIGHTLIYRDDMVVRHPSRGDWAALRRKWRRLNDETFALMKPGYRRRLIWLGRACAMPASALIHGIKIVRSPKLNNPAERLRAFSTLVRLRLTRAGWMLLQASQDKQ